MSKARDLADNSEGTKPKVVDAKGDLIVGTGADAAARLAVASTAGYVLTVDSGEATGLKWAAPAGGASFAGASAYDASNQTVTQYVSTAVTWTSEDFDTDAFHDTSTNTSRMTIPAGKGGYYAITGTLGFQSGGGGRAELFIRKNNVNYVAIRIANSEDPAINISEIMSLAAGDYVELFGFTESSSVTLKKGVYGHFSIAYLGA